ncbi:MAG: SPFH domain-containing protein [Polyangiales bacterium]
MAELSKLFFMRHLRVEPTSWVLSMRGGKVKQSGRGLAFWFYPLGASIVEIPLDDRELAFLFKAHTSDFQEVTAQGVITYRVANPKVLSERVSFAIDKSTGRHKEQPLDSLAVTLTQLAQELGSDYIARFVLRDLLAAPIEDMRSAIGGKLQSDEGLVDMGLEIVSVRVAKVAPTAEMEKALQMPTRERIQQEADEATFRRRAMAVEKERAITENEMATRLELAKREEKLIEQQGQNQRRMAEEKAEAARIRAHGEATTRKMSADAEAASIGVLEAAKNEAEGARMEIYRNLPQGALYGLAAQELAKNLTTIEHLNLSPDMLGPLLQRLGSAGASVMESSVSEKKMEALESENKK